MQKTILLTQNANGLSQTVTRWLYIFLGLDIIIKGVMDMVGPPIPLWQMIFNGVLTASGLCLLVLGIVLFNPKNRYAPKVVIDDHQISIRQKLFRSPTLVQWTDLSGIEFKTFALHFLFRDRTTLQVVLDTNAETSIEIKRALREVAGVRDVAVTGG